ncbi:Serine/threonine-protein kinase CTR1 [Tribonema minus]|uniref:Serine/threonine-protein kinase CTR1 n=1 Tax=Tribonema minus TaxID=303371 RepID=A0A835YS35_9STRA|nr:Serine/threonine-protein kinase CTR1 [Tribonema minus]
MPGAKHGDCQAATESAAAHVEQKSAPVSHVPPELSFNIPFDSVSHLKHLADGGMCHVYSGILGHTPCVLKQDKLQLASRDLDTELQVMQVLDHPNIVKLYGAGLTPEGLTFICMEALSGGTLAHYLGTAGSHEGGLGAVGRWLTRHLYMTLEDALRHAQGIASAISYMHTRAMPGAAIMHRDLKSSNLAFAADGTLKLFDFGLAKILRERDRADCSDRYKLTGNTGSLRYMAPEVALEQPYNETADVYSFSILLWELASLQRPFDRYSVADFRDRVVLAGERPPLNAAWPQGLQDLLVRCWAPNAAARPSIDEVQLELARIVAALDRRSTA